MYLARKNRPRRGGGGAGGSIVLEHLIIVVQRVGLEGLVQHGQAEAVQKFPAEAQLGGEFLPAAGEHTRPHVGQKHEHLRDLVGVGHAGQGPVGHAQPDHPLHIGSGVPKGGFQREQGNLGVLYNVVDRQPVYLPLGRVGEKVAEGVLAAESIWGENLNNIPGLTAAVKADLDSIQEKGMLETVKGIL